MSDEDKSPEEVEALRTRVLEEQREVLEMIKEEEERLKRRKALEKELKRLV